MLDRLMAFAVALSVLWHAIVGCCAHHEHRSSLEKVATVGQGCSHQCHGHEKRACVRTSHSGRLSLQASDSNPPADCREAACAMTAAAGLRTVVMPIDAVAWSVQPEKLHDCALPHSTPDGHCHPGIGFHDLGPMRRHLVLRVFLI